MKFSLQGEFCLNKFCLTKVSSGVLTCGAAGQRSGIVSIAALWALAQRSRLRSIWCSCSYGLIFFFFLIGPHLWHMEVPRLGVKLELQLPDYTTATATPDLSHICDRHHGSWQWQILNPLCEARHWTWNLMDTSWVLNRLCGSDLIHSLETSICCGCDKNKKTKQNKTTTTQFIGDCFLISNSNRD